MIDLHTHILPKMDDGSKSVEETAQLLQLLRQQGVTTVVATPHFYAQETPEAFLERRRVSVEMISSLVEGAPALLLGAEVAYFSGMGSCDALESLQIGQSKLLLVEMPFSDWTERMVEDICEIPVQLGLIPVLAHINRYPGKLQFPKYKDKLLRSGVYFQCNAEAFLTLKTRRWALDLMKRGYIHFLGSDCHNLASRPPKLDEARAVIEKKLGKGFLEDLDREAQYLLENP
ncbi:MAG: hypothetical protein IJZ56_03890 [Oscillospiraceae bacterium]|nr:hypothetical protein [Oscillospiraceae bacterium]